MSGFPILSLMILLPIAAAALPLFLSGIGARWLALGTTLILFVNGVAVKRIVGYQPRQRIEAQIKPYLNPVTSP